MKKVKEDLTGKQFGRWTVLKRVDDNISSSGRIFDMWLCECSCKNKTQRIVYGNNLKSNKSLSCGCLPKDIRHQNCLNTHNTYDYSNPNYVAGYTEKGQLFYFDKEDFDIVSKYIWYIGQDGYVVTHNPDKSSEGESNLIRMHRLVMDLTDNNFFIDHINRNRYDNRKSNLRIATLQQNSMNSGKCKKDSSSRFKGVCYHKRANKWVSYITINGKRVHLGTFDDEIEASQAYKNAAHKYFGEFSYDNSIKENNNELQQSS